MYIRVYPSDRLNPTQDRLGEGLKHSEELRSIPLPILIFFQDRYAHAKAIPSIDEQQDYELTGFQESGGKTLLKFKRKFDTCDPWDRKLEVRIRAHSFRTGCGAPAPYPIFKTNMTEIFRLTKISKLSLELPEDRDPLLMRTQFQLFPLRPAQQKVVPPILSKQSSVSSTNSGRMNVRKSSVHSKKRE